MDIFTTRKHINESAPVRVSDLWNGLSYAHAPFEIVDIEVADVKGGVDSSVKDGRDLIGRILEIFIDQLKSIVDYCIAGLGLEDSGGSAAGLGVHRIMAEWEWHWKQYFAFSKRRIGGNQWRKRNWTRAHARD
jgi:hypothetical protein